MLLRYAELFRVVWIGGRYGGGKTSLAVQLAVDLVQAGAVGRIAANLHLSPPWRVCSEYACFSDLMQAEEGLAIVFDESWSELGLGAPPGKVKEYLAFLRKKRSVLLLPSVIPLSRSVRVCQVRRVFNGFAFGIPLWLYSVQTDIGGRRPESYRHWWWYPDRSWGLYDHREFPSLDWRVYTLAVAGGADAGLS
jgi:hypothetical protein